MDLHPPSSPFMRMALDSEQCLYSNVQNVVMPNGKTRDLRIEISGFGKPISKVEVRMTDDSDPALLYILHVSESDFNAIKSQQGLLVDFSNFPVHLVKLIEQCLNSVKGFLLILEEHGLEGYLKVVQPIDLKNLCYLALRISRGSDSEVMRHMHNQIILLKKKLGSKEEDCARVQSQMVQLQQEVSLKEQQNQEYLRNSEDEKAKLQAKFSKEMDLLRDQLLQDRKRDLDSAAYQQKSLSTKIEDLSREASKYKNKHMQVCEKYEQAQQTIRELSLRISSLEDMQKSMSKEVADMRRHKAELENEFRKKDQDLDQSRSHAEALDKEVARLRTRLTRQEGQLKQADAEQVKMRSSLTRLQETIEARSDLVLQLNGDLTKANLIIKERQKDLDKILSEFQKLVTLKHDEEGKLKNLELEMKLFQANADRDQARIKALEETEAKLQEQLKAANEEISAKDLQHKKCGELISYLNRSLNRQHLDPSPPSTAHGAHGPSTLSNSAPSAPIFYTLGSSFGRAGAQTALHASGPPQSNRGAHTAINALPFSSTPLVASAAAGGFVGTTRRSYPGALIHPSVQLQESGILTETPAARPMVDRLTLSQVQAKEDSLPKKQSRPLLHQSHIQNNPKTMTKSKSHSAIGSASNAGLPKERNSERRVEAKVLDKENKDTAVFKPSAYFQPNKIITEF